MKRMDRYRGGRADAEAGAPTAATAPRGTRGDARGADARGETALRRPLAAEAGQDPAGARGVQPVVRFRNPLDGVVTWDDLVKGPITIANANSTT